MQTWGSEEASERHRRNGRMGERYRRQATKMTTTGGAASMDPRASRPNVAHENVSIWVDQMRAALRFALTLFMHQTRGPGKQPGRCGLVCSNEPRASQADILAQIRPLNVGRPEDIVAPMHVCACRHCGVVFAHHTLYIIAAPTVVASFAPSGGRDSHSKSSFFLPSNTHTRKMYVLEGGLLYCSLSIDRHTI